ncbi:cytochrome c oxidase subunit 5b-1, mitochondrial-like isoform X2 [Pyrus x bretschneideri]|uniref:cytochrome c oxidase subunit 5b-1, mitochondrial-like isoform X2 n=1 Tax=Pyrus x bretschneideri TaxID=225117 RepID=UPI00202F0E31|nr:cytochrome c oxidase subunit 5b-1, mitochondrial-like isoform X2 [Pyrus x bretschneideri]
MWRRVVSTSPAQLQNLAASASRRSSSLNHTRRFVISSASSPSSTPLPKSAPPAAPHIASASTSPLKKNPQEANPTATGHELEELEGRDVLEINYPVGPFGTKEAPAIVKSVYDKRIVGCPGIEGGDDEHDVVWFWLEKGKPYECPVCTQVFKLQVVGKGGPPDGHH